MHWLPLLCFVSAALAVDSNIIPKPQEATLQADSVVSLNGYYENVLLDRCGADPRAVHAVHLLRDKLKQRGAHEDIKGVPVTFEVTNPQNLKSLETPVGAEEAYQITITPKGIQILAHQPLGLLWGTQTLLQLIDQHPDKLELPCGTIRDWPAFPVRGLMHDVGRNFQSIDFLKMQLEVMSRYKLNTFHWHLTDNPAWRVESPLHPALNSAAGRTRGQDQQYSLKEIKAFVSYAYARGITVIPEMDCPGHSHYFNQSLGFGMQTPQGLAVLKKEIPAWAEVFPSPYFHLGSDEVGIKMANFVPDLLATARESQKRPIIWHPGAKIKDNDVILQLWASPPIPNTGQAYIDSRWLYTNHMDPLEAPCLSNVQACGKKQTDGLGLGGILCHWPDRRVGDEKNILTQNGLLPQLVGFSEGIWRGVASTERKYYVQCPAPNSSHHEAFQNLEQRMAWHRDHYFQSTPFPFVVSSKMRWLIKLEAPEVTTPPDFKKPNIAWGGLVYINHFWGSTDPQRDVPGWLPHQKTKTTAWASTSFYSPVEQDAHLIIGFNTVSSSEGRRGVGAPPAGAWSVLGHDVWLNETRIAPPSWKCAEAKEPLIESPMTDENWSMRAPPAIHLRAGWNKIIIKAPYHPGEPASWKWSFTCIPVKWDGVNFHEIPNLQFDKIDESAQR